MKNNKTLVNKSVKTALSGLLTLTTIGLSGCDNPQHANYVYCKNVSKSGKPIIAERGVCQKLAGHQTKAIDCNEWSKPNAKGRQQCLGKKGEPTVIHYTPDQYVKCYGVAASGMNDCGTPISACGGSIKQAGYKEAWIAIPGGICTQLKGGILKKPEQDD